MIKQAIIKGRIKFFLMPMVRRNISFQYVDDASLSLIGDEGNVDKVVNLFNLFLMVIRLELNWEKSLAYLPMELCNLNQTNL